MKFFYENNSLPARAFYGEDLSYPAHLHNHIELVFMLEGSSNVIVDSVEYTFRAGDALVVFPNQIHQYRRIDREKYFISIFSPDLCPEFQNIFQHKVPVSAILKGVGENKDIRLLTDGIYKTFQEEPPFYNTIIKGYFLLLLSELFQRMQFVEAVHSDADTIKEILGFCVKNYTRDIRLDTIANELHISKYYISHLFSQKLRIGFSDYLGMLRISDACTLLAERENNITEIAYRSGFRSTRSFNRLFQKYTGTTPGKYRNQFLGQSVLHP